MTQVLKSAAFAGLATIMMVAGSAADELSDSLQISRSFARLVTIPRPASTIVIGNEAILSATLSDPTTLVLTGQSEGATNLIILDDEGEKIVETLISVVPAAKQPVLRVHQGNVMEDYDCDIKCDRVPMAGVAPVIPTTE